MMPGPGHTHTLTYYIARHSPAQDGRDHKLSDITNNSTYNVKLRRQHSSTISILFQSLSALEVNLSQKDED